MKDGFLPRRIAAYASVVKDLGNVGTHSFGERITTTDVANSLQQLMPILEWYFAEECPSTMGRNLTEVVTGPPPPETPKKKCCLPSRCIVIGTGRTQGPAFVRRIRQRFLSGAASRSARQGRTARKHPVLEVADRAETIRAFPVGLIYGPSGCGKSSLVKAGLLPRLVEHVLPIYMEATPDTTERRLLSRLRQA